MKSLTFPSWHSTAINRKSHGMRLAWGGEVFYSLSRIVKPHRLFRQMTENLLTVGAIALELGMPALLIALAVAKPALRKPVVSVVGAVTPLLAFYLHVSVSHLVGSIPHEMAFHAMWIMSFLVYLVLFVVGLLFAIWSKPHGLLARYCLAALLAPLVAFTLLALERYAA